MDDKKKEKGAVQILCEEIGFRFDLSMERDDIFVAFVRVLVDEIERMRELKVALVKMGCKAPSDDSKTVLALVRTMLNETDRNKLVAAVAAAHDLIHEVAPDDMYPCDHLIDMLSSCVSAIRFGLESPCHSRHAASAAQHVWKKLYGISREDKYTSNWENDWARAKLQEAILSLVPAPASS